MDPNVVDIQINDGIGWYSAATLRNAINNAPAKATIRLYMNTPGGDVIEGYSLYNALLHKRKKGARVETYVTGLLASIGTVIALASDEIVMNDPSLFMIHKPWAVQAGDNADMQLMADVLTKIEGQIRDIYVNKSKQTPEMVAQWMMAETWFTPQEALDAGLIDRIQTANDGKKLPADFKNISKIQLVNYFSLNNMEKKPADNGKTVESDADLAKQNADLQARLAATEAEIERLKAKTEKAEADAKAEKAAVLIESFVKSKAIKAEAAAHWTKLAIADYDSTKEALNAQPVATRSLSSDLNNFATEISADRKAWTFKDWMEKDDKGLLEMKKGNASQWQALHDAHYAKVRTFED
jgi:ATP-dependent protease ClpP protease subunit/uncharacterized small protein (DUF1192 family)